MFDDIVALILLVIAVLGATFCAIKVIIGFFYNNFPKGETMRRIISLFVIVAALLVVSPFAVKAQTTVNSDGVSVRNSAPANVFFMFPLSSESNVIEIQLVCSAGTAPGAAFVYEEQPNGQIVTYDNPGTRVDCNETYGGHSPNFTFTGSLKNDIAVTTPDHTITITTSTAWSAANVSCGRSGYCWKATSGSSQIVVSNLSATIPRYLCGKDRHPCDLSSSKNTQSCWWDGKGASWKNTQCVTVR